MQDMAQMPGPPGGQHYMNSPSPEQKRKDDRSAYVETIEDVSCLPQILTASLADHCRSRHRL